MSERSRPRWVLPVGVLVLLLVASGATTYLLWPKGSELARASALLPPDTVRVTWTDWAGLRTELDAAPGTRDLDDLLLRAADRDLSSASATAAIAEPLARTLGWGPVDAEWEILGQSTDGMVLVVKLPEDADLDAIAGLYEKAGFSAPAERRTDGGLWSGGPDTVARLAGLNRPILQYAALLEDERLLVSSDQAVSVERTVPVARGDEDGLDVDGLVDPAGEPLAAVAWATDGVCADLSMGKADAGARARADQLLDEAGGIGPLTGYLVGLDADRAMTVVLRYEDADRAERDLPARRMLAGMEDPGQSLPYPELFRLDGARVEGDSVVLDLRDAALDAYPLTNTTSGPVLLAAC